MQCKCIDNQSNNGNFTLGRIYIVEENVGIWQPILFRFRDFDNPGKLSEGTIFEFAMCKFYVIMMKHTQEKMLVILVGAENAK